MKAPYTFTSPVSRYRIRAARAWLRRVEMRFPFRFGKAMMTELPVLTLRLAVENERGRIFEGYTTSGFPPIWFDKREGRSLAANENDLMGAVKTACEAALDAGFDSPFALHQQVQHVTRSNLAHMQDPMPPLAAGFGPALVEAALVDALCRELDKPFHVLLKADVFGFGAAGVDLGRLPSAPTARMAFRHTVGMGDALTASDVAAADRRSDGLPHTLSEVLAAYAPRYFKVKIGMGDEATQARLRALAQLLDAKAGDYRVTLDGNEQWSDASIFLELWKRLRADRSLQGLLGRILYVEQPVRRETALAPEAEPAVRELAKHIPLLLDEGDGEDGDPERALALGYTGISVKTCKGLFRAIRSFGLATAPAFLSSEDLTTVPALPLQQDLALAASLGLTHSERNGHHFAARGAHLTRREQAEALAAAPSLYAQDPGGGLRVRIEGGSFDLAEVNARGFGGMLIPDTHHQNILFSLPA